MSWLTAAVVPFPPPPTARQPAPEGAPFCGAGARVSRALPRRVRQCSRWACPLRDGLGGPATVRAATCRASTGSLRSPIAQSISSPSASTSRSTLSQKRRCGRLATRPRGGLYHCLFLFDVFICVPGADGALPQARRRCDQRLARCEPSSHSTALPARPRVCSRPPLLHIT